MACSARVALPCIVNGEDSAVFRFLFPVTLTFELQRDFCTTYLTAKFDRPTFSHLEVIVRTNKETPLKTSISLLYATPVGNYWTPLKKTLSHPFNDNPAIFHIES